MSRHLQVRLELDKLAGNRRQNLVDRCNLNRVDLLQRTASGSICGLCTRILHPGQGGGGEEESVSVFVLGALERV